MWTHGAAGLQLAGQHLEALHDDEAGNDRVGRGDGGDDVACHR